PLRLPRRRDRLVDRLHVRDGRRPGVGDADVNHLAGRAADRPSPGHPHPDQARPGVSIWGPCRSAALAASPAHDRAEGAYEDLQVELQRTILDVEEVVLELASDLGHRARVAALDLRPAGESRLHKQPRAEMRDLRLQVTLELGPLRAGTDEAHLAAHDVQKLRKLVQARGAEKPADPRHSLVALFRVARSAGLGVRGHRPQLEQAEVAAALADPPLRE